MKAAGYRRIGFVMRHGWDEFLALAWSAGFLAEQRQFTAADRIPIRDCSTAELPAGSGALLGPDHTVPPALPSS